ncbi:MAG: hypothetical protein RJA80_344 [Actinomycetota bacterium]
MAQSLGISKVAKTHKGRKVLESRKPKVVENPKTSFLMKGRKSSDTLNKLMREIHQLRGGEGPSHLLLHKTHDVMPFEDVTLVEKTSQKYDSSLFVVATH